MEFEIFIDSLLDDNRLLKDRLVVLLSDRCGLRPFVAKTSTVGGYARQDLRKSLVGIVFEQLEYSLCIESVFGHQAFIAGSNNVER